MASRSKGNDGDRKRLAAERAAQARRRIAEEQRRRRMLGVAGAVVAIVVVVAVLIVVRVATDTKPKSGQPATVASAAVTAALADVAMSEFNSIGIGTARLVPQPTSGSPLTVDGKPRVLFVGAEWCPYCAAERWVIAVALERFGSFDDLHEVSSSPTDAYPNTASLSFHGASYASSYLAFTGKELFTNQVSGDSYTKLDTLSGGDETLFEHAAGYPFIDLGGSSIINSAQYDPTVLKGKTQDQIAALLGQPKSAVAEGIIGSANLVTASLCKLTGNKPALVCSSSGVTTAAAKLPKE